MAAKRCFSAGGSSAPPSRKSRSVFVEQRQVLRRRGPEFDQPGFGFVVGGAQFGRIQHGVQMPHHAPGAAQLFGGVFQRFDKIFPGYFGHRRFQRRHHIARLRQEGIDGRFHMLGADRVEACQSGEIEQRIGGLRIQFGHIRFFPPRRWYSSAAS
jgi:hypothetical protein